MPPPNPILKAIIMCDNIITEANSNKRSLIGVFDRIYIAKFPSAHFPLWLYIAFTEAYGDYNIRVEFCEVAEGKVLAGANPNKPIHYSNREAVNELVFRFPPIPFPREGGYEFVVYANDHPLGQKTLRTIQRV